MGIAFVSPFSSLRTPLTSKRVNATVVFTRLKLPAPNIVETSSTCCCKTETHKPTSFSPCLLNQPIVQKLPTAHLLNCCFGSPFRLANLHGSPVFDRHPKPLALFSDHNLCRHRRRRHNHHYYPASSSALSNLDLSHSPLNHMLPCATLLHPVARLSLSFPSLNTAVPARFLLPVLHHLSLPVFLAFPSLPFSASQHPSVLFSFTHSVTLCVALFDTLLRAPEFLPCVLPPILVRVWPVDMFGLHVRLINQGRE